MFPFPRNPMGLDTAKHVVEEFRATGPDPAAFTSISYATVQALAEDVRRAGTLHGGAVAHALRTGDPVDTVFGPVAFDAKGDAEGMTYEINVWRNAHFGQQLSRQTPEWWRDERVRTDEFDLPKSDVRHGLAITA